MSERANIPISETWNRTDWSYFDTDVAQTTPQTLGRTGSTNYPWGLSTQQHIDIRPFTSTGWTASGGGSITIGNLSGTYNHLPGATLSLVSGTNTFIDQTPPAVDLTQIGTGGLLILTVPNFPTGSVDQTQSYIDLSSDGFVSHICSLQLSTSSPAYSSSNQVFTFPYSALTGINLANVTGVRLRIRATATATAYVLALRLVGPSWVPTSVDFDNRNGLLRPGVPANGANIGTAFANNTTMPTLWRSALVPSSDDPAPIDGEFGVLFYTGSSTATNSFTVYMRQISQAFITQINLQGTSQAQLTGQPQPTEGVSEYSPRTMADLERYTMGQLESESMLELERTNNPVYESWISFTVQWGTAPVIQITSSANPTGGYIFTSGFNLLPQTPYLAVFNLTDTKARAQIYSLGTGMFWGLLLLDYGMADLSLGNLVFDSQVIPDGFMFPRRAGRVGFFASLNDGDSYITHIRPRGLNFAQYVSKPLQSITPVVGAQLYTQTSPDISLAGDESNLVPLADNVGNLPLLTSDSSRYFSGDTDQTSVRVQMTTASGNPRQGVSTGWLTPNGDNYSGITDFGNLEIDMAIWMPSSAIPASYLGNVGGTNVTTTPIISAALVHSSGSLFPLLLPPLIPDQWTDISLKQPMSYPWPLSGLYKLYVWYLGPDAATWWIDGLSVLEKSVIWEGRSVTSDPWNSNYAPWTPFHDALNSQYDGAHFSTIGTDLQIRATARKQDAAIVSAPNIIPQYAPLGRLVWPEDYNVTGTITPATITPTFTGRNYTFASAASSTNGRITNYFWSFGDGSYAASGPTVQHTYSPSVASGTQYTVTLSVVDNAGLVSAVPAYTAIMS